jgi:lipoprotein LprG
MLRRLIALAVLGLSVGLLSACGPNNSDSKEARDQLLERLTTARAKLDKAETINLTLSAKTLPDGVSGLLSASGKGNHSPAFKGTVKVMTGGAAVSAAVFAADGEVWAKPSFSPIPLKIDPATLKAPDPASLFEPETGFSQVLVETTDLKEAGKSRDGKEVLTTISGTIPGSVVRAILPSADTAASFTATYRLTDDNELRDASISGPFYPKVADVTYDLTLSTSTKPLTVTLPK